MAAALLLPAVVEAGGLRISPIRLDLSARQPSAQVELSSSNAEPIAVQVKAFSWRQVNGVDTYEPTKDIFFAPPIVTVPAQGQISVRLRLKGKPDPAAETAYRVYFQELPPPGPLEHSGGGMTVRVRFGVPVFVYPSQAVAPAVKAQVAVAGETVNLEIENAGKAHLKVEGVEVFPTAVNREDPSGAVLGATQSTTGTSYILPGTRLQWRLGLPAGFDPAAHVLLVRTDDRSGRAGSGLSKRGWLWRPLVGAPETSAKP